MTYQWRDFVGALVDGKYPLVEYLGDVGANGVFATETVKSRPAIIRLAPGDNGESDRLLEQWRAATKISNPYVAATYAAGSGEVNGKRMVYTITERPDDSLAEAVRNRALTEDEARQLSKSLLTGLSALHQQDLAHNAVSPDNIVAVGESIKLAPWTISKATPEQKREDVFAAGQTVAEVLTQRRPENPTDLPKLPRPFADIASACLRRNVDAAEALQMLEGNAGQATRSAAAASAAAAPAPAAIRPATSTRSIEPEIAAPRRTYKLPTAAIVVASLGVLLLVVGVRSKSKEQVVTPAPIEQQDRPSPVNESVRQRTTSPAPAAPAASTSAISKGSWVVVADIYKQHEQATKRAEEISSRFKGWQAGVYPPEPKGRRFMVVLGQADSRKEGEAILARARSAGMGRKVYLTRINR